MTDDALRERVARAIYDILEGPVANQDFARQSRQWDLALTIAAAARSAIRNAALEEAARVADNGGTNDGDHIATVIRALKEKSST